MRLRLAVTALVIAILAFSPAVNAQQPPPGGYKQTLVSVQHYSGLVNPLGQHVLLNITVKLDCALAQADVPINFSVIQKPTWLDVTDMPGWRTPYLNNYTGYQNFPCDQSKDPSDPSAGYVTIVAPMKVNFTTYAPAYRIANFTVVVTRAGTVSTALGWIQAGFFGSLKIVPPSHIIRINGQDSFADVPFNVYNLANGEIAVTLTYTNPSGTHVDASGVMVLGAAQQGGVYQKTLDAKVYLDNFQGSSFQIGVNATGISRNASDPEAVTPAAATGYVTIAFSLPGPAPDAVASVLAICAGAVVLMRWRRL
jgi:hypothetical protein